MELGRINRDRSGRVPRASSRTGAFYQSCSDWNVPGTIETPIPQDPPVRISTMEGDDDDLYRGSGY